MAPQSSKNLFLAVVVALSVYAPFEAVAKASLIASVVLFVADPLPPYSRLIALSSCWLVLKLNAAHRQLTIRQQHEAEQASLEIRDENQNEERRKWMRNQQQKQQQQQQQLQATSETTHERNTNIPDGAPSGVPGLASTEATTGAASIPSGDVRNAGSDIDIDIDHNYGDPSHPPDCLCVLRKQSRGMTFFRPSMLSSSSSTTTDGDDDALAAAAPLWCTEIAPPPSFGGATTKHHRTR
eukprot:jgi/Psemu1/283678/fgenesh1_pg.31_\